MSPAILGSSENHKLSLNTNRHIIDPNWSTLRPAWARPFLFCSSVPRTDRAHTHSVDIGLERKAIRGLSPGQLLSSKKASINRVALSSQAHNNL